MIAWSNIKSRSNIEELGSNRQSGQVIKVIIRNENNYKLEKYADEIVSYIKFSVALKRRNLEYWSSIRSIRLFNTLNDDMKSLYSDINRNIENIEDYSNSLGCDEDVKKIQVERLKSLRKEARNMKAYYKAEGIKIKEEMYMSKQHEQFIHDTEEYTKGVVSDWLQDHKIQPDKQYLYEEDNIVARIKYLASIPMTNFAYPTEYIIKTEVERHLRFDTSNLPD